MESMTVSTELVRTAAQSLGSGGKEISVIQVCEALALDTIETKARARTRMNHMQKHGELTRVRDGVYIYNFDKRPRDPRTYSAIWRFVRKGKPGWSLNDASLMTRVSYRQTSRYCQWLLEEGYLALHGKNGKATLYRATSKADACPETPYPPLRETDPFEREKSAAVHIINALLKQDPYAAKTARTITEAARVLLARFESTPEKVTENENTEVNNHVE